jgi:hypothetical protein
VDVAAQPVVEGWLGDLRRARQIPARTKVCKKCGADVALDSFRRKSDDGYLCTDCVDRAQARLDKRRQLLSRMLVIMTFVALAGAITAGAIQLAPVLMAPRAARPR